MSNVIKSNQVKSGEKVKLDNSNFKLQEEQTESPQSEEKEEANQIIDQAEKKADEIIAEAKEKAEQIKTEAQQEIEAEKEEVFAEAKEEGYQAGLTEGREAGKKEGRSNVEQQFANLLQQVQSEVDDFHQTIESREENMKNELIELAIAISEKIVAQELKSDKTVLENMIRKKLKLLEEGENLKLRIHPSNLDLLQEVKEDLIITNGYIEEIKIIGDDDITDNGVIIETDFGGLDATISTQLQKIKDELLGVDQNG